MQITAARPMLRRPASHIAPLALIAASSIGCTARADQSSPSASFVGSSTACEPSEKARASPLAAFPVEAYDALGERVL